MATEYGTLITTAGAAKITSAITNGTQLNITQAAAGDGNGSPVTPDISMTELVNEVWRGEIASASVNSTTSNMIDVKVVIGDDVGGFTIREMGLFDEEGTLIAICNTPDTEKVAISGGVSGKFTMVMHIIVADASVVSFTIEPALDSVSSVDLEQAIIDHNIDSAAHEDIRELIENAVQSADVYTKTETDAAIDTDVDAHNTSETAHAAMRVDLTNLSARVTALELRYGTNVTGNSFEVTFVSLDGLTVTGVWNTEMARIEF